MAQKNEQGISGAAKTGIGLAAIAAAAGAYYFYGSKHSAQHRKQMKSWAIKARGEVVERLEKAKDVSQDSYQKIVDQVMDKYSKVKSIDPTELQALAGDLRRHWKSINSHLQSKPAKRIKPKKVK